MKKYRMAWEIPQCEECGWGKGTLDRHRIIPGKHGGKYEPGNVAKLCPSCHRLKHQRIPPMPRLYHMTYIPAQRQWTKMHNGRRFYISCKKLGCEPTKEASWRAANAWWEAKRSGIKATAIKEGSAEAINALLSSFAGRKLEVGSSDQFSMASQFLEYLQDLKAENPKDFTEVTRFAVGDAGLQACLDARQMIQKTIEAVKVGIPRERLVSEQARIWLDFQLSRARSGTIEAGTLKLYRGDLATFMDWHGRDRTLDTINDELVSGYYAHLCDLDLSSKTKQSKWATFRQLLNKLWEKELIELPRNLSGNDFVFRGESEEKTLWSMTEFRETLAGATGLKRLCILLAANCGMYFSDMARIKSWSDGKIVGKRSKTRKKAGQATIFYLWPETIAALDEAGHLLPTVATRSLEGGRATSKTIALSGLPRPIKYLRHTSATLVKASDWREYRGYFLAHKESMADSWYAHDCQERIKEMFGWLRVQYLG